MHKVVVFNFGELKSRKCLIISFSRDYVRKAQKTKKPKNSRLFVAISFLYPLFGCGGGNISGGNPCHDLPHRSHSRGASPSQDYGSLHSLLCGVNRRQNDTQSFCLRLQVIRPKPEGTRSESVAREVQIPP